MTSGPDDALAAHELDLVTRAAKGDEAAFDRFFERNGPAVQLLVERLLGPGETADGVVLEAFEKTVRRLPLLGARNLSPALYVLSTARNGAYAALGRGRPTAEGGPLAALLALPSRQRELLALRELGLTQEACAQVAGIEPGEVGVQVARARLRLTDELEGLALSNVFADERAERLLAAEVVRTEGQPVPEALEAEITAHADEDSRFAAALSAVRSPSRSVGQLSPVTGASRLVAQARAQAVGAGAGAQARSVATPPAAPTPAPPVVAPDAGVVSGPRSVPISTGDPYDDDIGDEMAWGIVEDDEDGAFAATGSAPGSPAVDAPSDGQWEDGAGSVSEEPPTQLVPPPTVAGPAGPEVAAGSSGAHADPFAGWDDGLDWSDEDREWGAGPGAGASPAPGGSVAAGAAARSEEPTALTKATGGADGPVAGAPIAAAGGGALEPHPPADPGETRAFDAVAAGLVDPDPIPVADFGGDGEGHDGGRPRRSKWRWLIWFVALGLLFAGVALATYAIQQAKQDPGLPPTSTLDRTTPAPAKSSTKTPKATTPKKTSSLKRESGTTSASSGSTGSSASTSRPTSSSSSSTGGSGATATPAPARSATSGATRATGAPAGGETAAAGGGSTTSGSGTDAQPAAAPESQVVAGESSSGGTVRGSDPDTTGGATP